MKWHKWKSPESHNSKQLNSETHTELHRLSQTMARVTTRGKQRMQDTSRSAARKPHHLPALRGARVSLRLPGTPCSVCSVRRRSLPAQNTAQHTDKFLPPHIKILTPTEFFHKHEEDSSTDTVTSIGTQNVPKEITTTKSVTWSCVKSPTSFIWILELHEIQQRILALSKANSGLVLPWYRYL